MKDRVKIKIENGHIKITVKAKKPGFGHTTYSGFGVMEKKGKALNKANRKKNRQEAKDAKRHF